MKTNHKKKIKKHVDTRLRVQLYIFFAVFLGMLLYSLFEVLFGVIGIFSATFGLLLGIIGGIVAGRISNIFWHPEKNKVVSQIDITGGVILVGYILFSVFRNRIFGHWLSGAQLSAFGFTFLAGTMFGRVLTTGISIKKVLLAQGVIK